MLSLPGTQEYILSSQLAKKAKMRIFCVKKVVYDFNVMHHHHTTHIHHTCAKNMANCDGLNENWIELTLNESRHWYCTAAPFSRSSLWRLACCLNHIVKFCTLLRLYRVIPRKYRVILHKRLLAFRSEESRVLWPKMVH